MLAKCIGITFASFAFAMVMINYGQPAPETTATGQTEMVAPPREKSLNDSNSATAQQKLPQQLDKVIHSAEATIEMLQAKQYAQDKRALAAKLKQVRSDLRGTIANNQSRLIDTPLRQSKALLGQVQTQLERDAITPVEAQEIAVITFQSIIIQAKRARKFALDAEKSLSQLSDKMKGHEQAFLEAALRGVEKLQD